MAALDHNLAITASGALYTWGYGGHGQLGHGDQLIQYLPKRIEGLQGVCCVAAGGAHSIAIAKDGTALGWGYGEDTALGLQLTDHQLTPLDYNELRLAVP